MCLIWSLLNDHAGYGHCGALLSFEKVSGIERRTQTPTGSVGWRGRRGQSGYLRTYENYLCCNCLCTCACRTCFFVPASVYKVIHHCHPGITQFAAHIKLKTGHVVTTDEHYVLRCAISSFICLYECVCVTACIAIIVWTNFSVTLALWGYLGFVRTFWPVVISPLWGLRLRIGVKIRFCLVSGVGWGLGIQLRWLRLGSGTMECVMSMTVQTKTERHDCVCVCVYVSVYLHSHWGLLYPFWLWQEVIKWV